MKRIAAIITLTAAALAVPATAMASTGGSGSSNGYNNGYSQVNPGGPVRVVCPLSPEIHLKGSGQAEQITYANGQPQAAWQKVYVKRARLFCPLPRGRFPEPPAQVCAAGTVTFSMPPSSGTFTEYSGPQLYTGETLNYNDTTYTVASVSGAVFTLNANGQQFINGHVGVANGTATASCANSTSGS
jgi:hypothetical protein